MAVIIGYMRPYVGDEECEKQREQLQRLGCEIIVQEEHASAKRRAELKTMMSGLKPRDVIVVSRLFTLADSTRHLMEMLEQLDEHGAYLLSLQEEIDTRTPHGANFKSYVTHLLEFQSDVISEKTKQGLYEAKQKGITAGRPRKPDENVKRAIIMYESKQYSLADIKEATGISKSTLYRYLENETN